MPQADYIIIDFDSTFISKESLDMLAETCLKRQENYHEIFKKIEQITERGMSGEINFKDSLYQRIRLIKASKKEVVEVSINLKKYLSKSFLKNKKFIKNNRDKIFFISGGFREMLLPVLKIFGIDENHIFGNDFIYNNKNEIIGFNRDNPLSSENGKAKILEMLRLEGEVHAIGDGFNDYLLKKSGKVSSFYAFTENVYRKEVCAVADEVLTSFDDYIEIFS
tara:strand:+ start:34155 stop:34820 length:666 start_codon:yes stop_codon:yes gene_type:complete